MNCNMPPVSSKKIPLFKYPLSTTLRAYASNPIFSSTLHVLRIPTKLQIPSSSLLLFIVFLTIGTQEDLQTEPQCTCVNIIVKMTERRHKVRLIASL